MGAGVHVTSFCCCLGLEMGAKLIGFLHLVVSVCLLVMCCVYASTLGELAAEAEGGDEVYLAWHKAAIAVSVVSSGHLVLALALLYGVYKRNRTALRVWVWVMTALAVAGVAFNVVGSVVWGSTATGSDIFLAFLEGLLFYGFVAYCILCVHSFCLLVGSCEDEPEHANSQPTNYEY